MAKKWVEVPANATGYRAPEWTNQMKNMPEVNCSDYDKCDLWILDDVDRGPNVQGGAGSPGFVQHESCCNDIYDVFSNVFTDCTVHSLRMQPGEREEDFTQKIAVILEQYNSSDLVVFYYHGKAGAIGDDYTWRFRGPGPRHINACDSIRQANGSRADCYFILDCFIPTNFPKKWMRKDAMTEFSITGHQLRDDHGRPVNGAGNFTESLCRAVRAMANKPRGDLRQSIPHIMRRDKTICSRPIRIWTARPNRKKRNKVWRFYVDIGRFKENGRFQLCKCRITGRRPGDGEFDDDSDDDGDGDLDGDNDEDDDGDDDEGGGGDDDNDEDSEDPGGNEDGDTGGGRGPDRRNDGDGGRRHMGDATTNVNQDDGNDENDTDATFQQLRNLLSKQLRKIPKGGSNDSPEAMRRMRGLLSYLQPTDQQPNRAPKRLFGQQLPSTGLGGGERAGLRDRDDGESLFLPRNDTQRPPAKRAKRLAATANENISHSANVMDLGDEDETANDANNTSPIERLIDQNNDDVSRPHLRAMSRVPSPTLKEEKMDDFKKSSSPYFDFGGDPISSDHNPIKRERSESPGFEIVGSRFIPCHIDLTDDGGVVELTQEDESEES